MTLIQSLLTGPSRWKRGQFWGLVLGLLALSIWTAGRWHTQVAVAGERLSDQGAQMLPFSVQSPTAPVGRDFTASLTSPVNEASFLAAMEAGLMRNGLSLEGLSVTKTAPTTQDLERVILQVSLSGAYGATVELVDELLGRFPGTTLQSMEITRKDARGVDTALVLSLWGQPLRGGVVAGSLSVPSR